MARLIDADALLKAIIEYPYPYGYRGMIKSEMENQPTVDAVPVVRCGVCLKKRLCILYRETNDENGFCSWAEGKEE